MEIIKCKLSDANELARVVIETWQTAYDGILPQGLIATESIRQRQEYLDQYYDNALRYNWSESYLIRLAGRNIGCFTFSPCKDHDVDATAAELLGMHIVKGFRRQGLGTQCLAFIENELKQKGYTKVLLWVLRNNINPINFYIKHGFEPDGACRSVVLGDNLLEQRYAKNLA